MNAIAVAVAVDLKDFVSSNDSGINSSRATKAIAPPAKPSPAGKIGKNYSQQVSKRICYEMSNSQSRQMRMTERQILAEGYSK